MDSIAQQHAQLSVPFFPADESSWIFSSFCTSNDSVFFDFFVSDIAD
jgi:hypothetical protein